MARCLLTQIMGKVLFMIQESVTLQKQKHSSNLNLQLVLVKIYLQWGAINLRILKLDLSNLKKENRFWKLQKKMVKLDQLVVHVRIWTSKCLFLWVSVLRYYKMLYFATRMNLYGHFQIKQILKKFLMRFLTPQNLQKCF